MAIKEQQAHDVETQKQAQKPKLEKKDLKPGTPERKKVGEVLSKDSKVNKSKAELLKAVESREVTKEKFDRERILTFNVKLTKADVPEVELQKKIELVKLQEMKKAEVSSFSNEELEAKALEQMTNELGEKGREAVVQKRIKNYDNQEALTGPGGMPLKDKEGNIILKLKFEKLQKENPDIKKMVEKFGNDDLAKELLAIYGEKKISGYADVLAKKGAKTLEEAEKIIQDEVISRQVESGKYKLDKNGELLRDKNGNPIELSDKEKKELADSIREKMNSNPKYAEQMASQMSGNQGISESQAHNVQPEALNLTGTARERTLNLIRHFEGFSPVAYGDYSQASRGYGTKAPRVGMPITKQKAEKELEDQVNNKYGAVHVFGKEITDKLGPNQIAALSSYLFNTGVGKASKFRKPLKDYVNGGSIEPVLKALSGPKTAGGQILKGLVKRRKTESKLFEEGAKDKQDEKKSQKVETPKAA